MNRIGAVVIGLGVAVLCLGGAEAKERDRVCWSSHADYFEERRAYFDLTYSWLNVTTVKSVYYVGKPAYLALSKVGDVAFDGVTNLGSGPTGIVTAVLIGQGIDAAVALTQYALEYPEALAAEIGGRSMERGLSALNDNYDFYRRGISSLDRSELLQFRKNQVYVDLMGSAKDLYLAAKGDQSITLEDMNILDALPTPENAVALTNALAGVSSVKELTDVLLRHDIDLGNYAPYEDYERAVNAVRKSNGIVPCKTEDSQRVREAAAQVESRQREPAAIPQAETLADMPSYCHRWKAGFKDIILQRVPEEIIACLRSGADPSATNGVGQTPLHVAIYEDRNLPVVTLLLESGANPDAQDGNGETPAHYAAYYNSPAAILALADAGADLALTEAFDQRTPLHIAAMNEGKGAAIAALLEAGANPRAEDKWGFTPMETALYYDGDHENYLALKSTGVPSQCRETEIGSRKYFKDMTPAEVLLCADAAGGVNAPNEFEKATRLLHWAALSHEDPAVIDALVERGADPDAQDGSWRTPLHLAVMTNENPAVIESLLDSGADPNVQDNRGIAPLYYAAGYNRDPAVIDALVEAGADARFVDSAQRSPLHRAAEINPNPAVAAALMERGIDPNLRSSLRRTPLHDAVINDANPAVIAMLLDAGAYPNARDHYGKTPLDIAIENGQPIRIVAALEARVKHVPDCDTWHSGELFGKMMPGDIFFCLNEYEFADLSETFDFGGYSILHMAARDNPDPEVIRELLHAGFDVNLQADFGETPLHLAASRNVNIAVIRELVDAGADINALGDEMTPLYSAVEHGQQPDIISFLLNIGADPDMPDWNGQTALHLATLKEAPETVAALLKGGATASARDNNGATALHLAVRTGNLAVVSAFLDHGVDPNVRGRSERSPLHDAVLDSEDRDIVKALLDAGAQVNAQDRLMKTPLHRAARYLVSPEIIVILLEAGADPGLLDADRKTPLQIAIDERKPGNLIEALRAAAY